MGTTYHLSSDEIKLRSPFINIIPVGKVSLYESNSNFESVHPNGNWPNAIKQKQYEDEGIEQSEEDANNLTETEIHWWTRHRVMQKGDKGEDVGKLQKVLGIRITNVYDDTTLKAVMTAQKRRRLKQDGKVGPFTYAMLFYSDYEYSIKKPSIVKQKAYTCWAASFESAIPSWKGRINFSIPSLLAMYKSFLESRGDISFKGLSKVVEDFNGTELPTASEDFKIESIRELLLKTNSHLIMVIALPGSVAHAEVIYGFGVQKGDPYLLVMDPLNGEYKKHYLIDIHNLSGTIIIISRK